MKRTPSLLLLLLLIITPAVVIFAGLNEKKLKVELTKNQWLIHNGGLNYVIDRIRESDLNAKQQSVMIDSVIVPLQRDIISQIVPQMDTTKGR
jgi:hypothetical protein